MLKHRPRIAYFCMEYGLESDFKLYSGGLGILAGDYLKAAHELNLPVIGIGLLWKQGYTQQVLRNKKPVDCYPVYSYDFLQDTGIKVKVRIRERDVFCKVWLVDKFDNAPLYLLDTALPENDDPWITGQLYGWFSEERIAQEMVLGIGGVRALRALELEVDLYHFNEGHAAFAGLELISEKMEKDEMTFREAWETTKEQIVFTTHTPIKEGNEEHPHSLLKYMGADHGLTLEQLVQIGGVPFNMTVAGLRLARISNGVSQLHSQTAREMWQEIPDHSKIIGITNGVHRQTWVSKEIIAVRNDAEKLWATHLGLKKELLAYVEAKTGQQLRLDSLLIGFARRAAPYKRGDFIFSDQKVIAKLLAEGKIQIIFSGKAHPLDDTGKGIVTRQAGYARLYPESVVFLEDYNMEIGRYLTRGCDLWLNNPRRPKEACGTSGIKAAMNGVLNFSVLDGWWAEACCHGENGWQLGEGLAINDFTGSHPVKKQDQHDLHSLYQVLLEEIIPIYYEQRRKWIKMMQNSIESTYQTFSARRMLQDYYREMYEIK